MTPCSRCRRPIGKLRLRAVPTATLCRQCQERAEYYENLAGRGPLGRARAIAEGAMAEVSELDLAEVMGVR